MFAKRALTSALVAMSAVAAAPRAARAHALLVTPRPRDQQDGYKDPPRAPPGTGAPCGIGRMVPPQPETGYAPGQPLHVEWKETVTHPGCFVLDFAPANDANFQLLGVKSHAGNTAALPRPWSLDVTLPSVTCAPCTLRLRQLMLPADLPDAQCPPAIIPAAATYYSCANITLGDGTPGDGGATGTGGSTATGAGGSSGSGQAGTDGGQNPGGGCAVATGHAVTSWGLVLLTALMLRGRRPRSRW